MIPPDAAHIDAMAQCTSNVPLTADEASSLVTPSTSAAATLEQWAAANAADSYGGLEMTGSSSYIVHIVRSAPSAAALAAQVAGKAAFSTADAAWSIARLQSTAEQIATTPGPLAFVEVYPDVASNQVVVVARTAAADAVANFRASWNSVPLVLRFDDVTTYRKHHRRVVQQKRVDQPAS